MFSFKYVELNKTNSLLLPLLSLIRTSLHMNLLSSRWNKFRKAPDCSQVLSALAGTIRGETDNEMTNIMMNCMHLYKELKKELVRVEFTEEKNFTRGSCEKYGTFLNLFNLEIK